MQLAATPGDSARRWAAIPSLASMSALGGPKPGADVLAVTGGPGGVPRALVAVQRFGDGRSMIFTGEASWRWKMNLPAQDQSFDRFWRQALRWLAQPAPEPVSITLPAAAAAGDGIAVSIVARDRAYLPRPDALVDVRITAPSGRMDTVRARPRPGPPACSWRRCARLSPASIGSRPTRDKGRPRSGRPPERCSSAESIRK